MAKEITVLRQEAEQHLRALKQLARRTVKEAWLAGEALMRIKEQPPHGGWRAGLEERGISKSTAHRFIILRKRYSEMSQFGTFQMYHERLDLKETTFILRKAGCRGVSDEASWNTGGAALVVTILPIPSLPPAVTRP